MLIIIHEDSVYLSWIRRHRNGFVLDTRPHPTRRNTTLHRANCDQIRHSSGRSTHWTTGKHVKVCALDPTDLLEWFHEQTGQQPMYCRDCTPLQPPSDGRQFKVATASPKNLTPLAQDLLSTVIESAVINLDNETPYELTVAKVSELHSKSPAQLRNALLRLVEAYFVDIPGISELKDQPHSDLPIYPTMRAMRTLPAFDALADDELQAELSRLRMESS